MSRRFDLAAVRLATAVAGWGLIAASFPAAAATFSPGTAGAPASIRSPDGGASAIYSISKMTSPLTETVAVGQGTYTQGSTVTTVATVKSNGVPVDQASVTFRLIKPNGSMVAYAATTDANGQAFYPYQIAAGDPPGAYRSGATAVSGGATVYTSVSFSVQESRQ